MANRRLVSFLHRPAWVTRWVSDVPAQAGVIGADGVEHRGGAVVGVVGGVQRSGADGGAGGGAGPAATDSGRGA